MNLPPIILLLFSISIAVLILKLIFSKKAVVKRRLKKLPTIPINQFQERQYGRIIGNAVAHDRILRAPLSGRKCVYYQVEVLQRTNTGSGNSHWRKVISTSEAVDFFVIQGDDKALIDTSRFEGHLHEDHCFDSGTFNEAPPKVEKFLNQMGKSSKSLFFDLNVGTQYREGVIELGERVAVAGTGFWNSESGENILEIRSTAENIITISDHRSVTSR